MCCLISYIADKWLEGLTIAACELRHISFKDFRTRSLKRSKWLREMQQRKRGTKTSNGIPGILSGKIYARQRFCPQALIRVKILSLGFWNGKKKKKKTFGAKRLMIFLDYFFVDEMIKLSFP